MINQISKDLYNTMLPTITCIPTLFIFIISHRVLSIVYGLNIQLFINIITFITNQYFEQRLDI